jgi:hypothetical protein
MKKALGVLFCVVLVTAFLPRPAAAEVTLDLGLKGGINLASVKYSFLGEGDNSSSVLNPVIGGFLAINLNKTFAFQPEVYFLNSGGKWAWQDIDFSLREVEKIGSIHIPLLAKVHLMQEGQAIPILFAGPAVDFILSAKGKFYVDDVLDDEYDFKEFIKHTTFSVVFGGGVEIMMDKLMLVLEGRYALGLTDLHADADEVYKLKGLMVMVGIGF